MWTVLAYPHPQEAKPLQTPDTTHSGPVLGDPPQVNIVLATLAKLIIRLMGWRIDGELPRVPKVVIIIAPHTANIDGIMLLLASWALRVRIHWMVKAEWTRRPVIGWLAKRTGALGIDRSAARGTVPTATAAINAAERYALIIPPEGTRRKTNHWKSGFYWIAHSAGVPILPAKVNYRDKIMDISPPLFMPTGDINADMTHIWAHYQEGAVGRFPEKTSDMRLRPSALRRSTSEDTIE